MSFAQIQAAFAANGAAPVQQPTPTPNPLTFNPGAAAQPQAPAAPTFAPNPVVTAPAAPAQQAFAFTPPAGFNPASAPPINPPGERVALPTPAPAPVAAPEAPADPSPPKCRGRKPKADAAAPVQAGSAEAPDVALDLADAIALVRDLLPPGTRITVSSARKEN
jgi:hypothetical protein